MCSAVYKWILAVVCLGSVAVAQGSGMALVFNGSNGVNNGDPAGNEFDLVGDGTIEAWVRVDNMPPAALGGTCFTITGKDIGPGTNNHKWFWGLQNGRLAHHINGPGYGNGFWVYSDAFALTLGQWYHYAIEKNGNDLTFYANGILLGTKTIASATVDVPTNMTTGFSEPCCNMNGHIDELRFWSRRLTQDEIKHHMCEVLDGTEPGLVAYYPMDEGVDNSCGGGEDVCDTSGNGHHGIKF